MVEMKVVMLGKQDAGKNTLVDRYIRGNPYDTTRDFPIVSQERTGGM